MNDTLNVPHDLESPSRRQAVSILVPTFLEAANIPSLAERIHAALSDRGIAWELLLIDDNSDDGSDAVVAELARRLPVRMVTRHQLPRDLSLSVIEGIRLCRFDRLVVMDADLSIRPSVSPICSPPSTMIATWSSAAATRRVVSSIGPGVRGAF